jgi:hypothetical protein
MTKKKINEMTLAASELLARQGRDFLELSFKESNENNDLILSDFRVDGCKYVELNENFLKCSKVPGFRHHLEEAMEACPVRLLTPTLSCQLHEVHTGNLEIFEAVSVLCKDGNGIDETLSQLAEVDPFVSEQLRLALNQVDDVHCNAEKSTHLFPAAVCVVSGEFPDAIESFEAMNEIIREEAVEIAQLGEEGSSISGFHSLSEFEVMLEKATPVLRLLKHFEGSTRQISARLQF